MDFLIIGGSRFLGRAIIKAARVAGHTVTAFNRGRSWPEELSDVELLVGDRNTDLHVLNGRSWDAVIDTCGFGPAQVAKSATALVDRVARYVFISTISVYPWPVVPDVTEAGDLALLPDGLAPDGPEPEAYGARKALCEAVTREIFGNRSIAIRPGMIVGPHDSTERFDYWVKRAARGGEMLVPGRAERALQLIDVDDLATWTLHLAQSAAFGAVNAAGPSDGTLDWGRFIETCLIGTGASSEVRWVDEAALTQVGMTPGPELPWWTGENENGIFEVNLSGARRLGLRTRPLLDTVQRTYAYLRATNNLVTNCLSPAREAEILRRALAMSR